MQIINETELQVLIDAIYTRYGLDFNLYESSSFIRRVGRALDKLQVASVYDLWSDILSKKLSIEDFINEITVGLTEMFRNPELWKKLREDVLTKLANIDIWHAGCSTGEEVYTMTIVLKEMSKLQNSNILATDINTNFLKEAQKASIRADLAEKYNKNYQSYTALNRNLGYYYNLNEDLLVLDKSMQKKMQFQVHNLSKDNMPQSFDMIFCRNVMIYFDEVLKQKVIELFHQSLREGGFLVIGYYDVLPKNYKNLFTSFSPEFKIFQKK